MGALTQTGQQVPYWWYRGSRPSSDSAYFENLCRIIFQTGLNWLVVEKKWQAIKKAFNNFNVDIIANLSDTEVKRLLDDVGIIRNIFKICAIIENAKSFQEIAKEYGSFRSYLDSFDKSNNYSKVVKALADRFERIGPTTAALYLLSVGESIKPTRMY
jgi:DNA-3-methyladenine glycosylase I